MTPITPAHLQVQKRLAETGSQKVTSEYVLMELGDGLSRLRFRHLAVKLIALIQADPSIEIIPASTDWFDLALSLFENRTDKEWGLTDCSSFAIMQHTEIDVALTADHHFQQAGYRALMLEHDV